MNLLPLGLALLVGFFMGALGSGGSIMMVPILVYLVGMEPRASIATSLMVVCLVSMVGAFRAWRVGRVRLRTGLTFASSAVLGSFGGAFLGRQISEVLQLTLFGAVVGAAAFWMLRRADGRNPSSNRTVPLFWLLSRGFGVGILTGLVGVGGGFMIVPTLVLLGPGMSMQDAAGTSLMVIALTSLTSATGYVGYFSLPWQIAASFSGLAAVGVLVGGRLADRLRSDFLQRFFAWFMLGIAIFVLAMNLPSLLGS